MWPRKQRLWWWLHNDRTAKLVKQSEKRENGWTRRNPDFGDQELRTRNDAVGTDSTEPAQRVPMHRDSGDRYLLLPFWNHERTQLARKASDQFPFVSPVQTVRAPDAEPPVSHYRACPYHSRLASASLNHALPRCWTSPSISRVALKQGNSQA